MQQSKHSIISSFLLCIGLILGGFFPGYYYYLTKFNNNTVTVKGLAEQNVTADLAIWKLKLITTDNNLDIAQQLIQNQTKETISFLKTIGFNDNEINTSPTDTQDTLASPYRNNEQNSPRFILSQTITIKSNNVDLVENSIPKTDTLIAKGIVFDNSYGDTISYIFTKLNEIKPQMLEQATKNALKSAQEFAKNSNSKVGKIKHANQGVFTILSRDNLSNILETEQKEKTIRVVTTIEYWLE